MCDTCSGTVTAGSMGRSSLTHGEMLHWIIFYLLNNNIYNSSPPFKNTQDKKILKISHKTIASIG
jgi:hypothetical protein